MVDFQIPYIRAFGPLDFCCGGISGKIEYGSGKKTLKFNSAMNPNTGDDIALVIDSTGSMSDDIEKVRETSRELVDKTFRLCKSAQFAVIEYNDPTYSVVQPLTSRKEDIVDAIDNGFVIRGGGDLREHVYSGLRAAVGLNWRNCARRSTITMGDAPPKDPEPGTGLTKEKIIELANSVAVIPDTTPTTRQIANDTSVSDAASSSLRVKAVGLTPFNMIRIGSDEATRKSFTELAEGSGGEFYEAASAEEIVPVLTEAITDSISEPSPTPEPISKTEDLSVNILCGSDDAFLFRLRITNPNSFPVKIFWRSIGTDVSGSGIISPPSTVISFPRTEESSLIFSLSWEQVELDSFKTEVFTFSEVPICGVVSTS